MLLLGFAPPCASPLQLHLQIFDLLFRFFLEHLMLEDQLLVGSVELFC